MPMRHRLGVKIASQISYMQVRVVKKNNSIALKENDSNEEPNAGE